MVCAIYKYLSNAPHPITHTQIESVVVNVIIRRPASGRRTSTASTIYKILDHAFIFNLDTTNRDVRCQVTTAYYYLTFRPFGITNFQLTRQCYAIINFKVFIIESIVAWCCCVKWNFVILRGRFVKRSNERLATSIGADAYLIIKSNNHLLPKMISHEMASVSVWSDAFAFFFSKAAFLISPFYFKICM